MFKSIALGVSALVLSASVNAVVLNTLNGVDYEWLELTETAGLSRDAVESRLVDVNDDLYGYEYASRQIVEDLLLSYASWDGLNGTHGAAGVLMGVESFINDFGVLDTFNGDGVDATTTTADGYTVSVDGWAANFGLYGLSSECGSIDSTCYSLQTVYNDASGVITMARQDGDYGWDATFTSPILRNTNDVDTRVGSYLVRTSVVPVPAAAWLFGSGLLGLIGVARRKKHNA